MKMKQLLETADRITLRTEQEEITSYHTDRVKCREVEAIINKTAEGLCVSVYGEKTPVCHITLFWHHSFQGEIRILGDHWERGYGDFEWRGITPERILPWYCLVASREETYGFGVKTGPTAFCSWQINQEGISLNLDLRCGGEGVVLNGRKLEAAVIVSAMFQGKNVYASAECFIGLLNDRVLLCEHPVYGSNNWYYAYGNSSAEEILADTAYLAKLTEGIENRPYMVIDDGWQQYHHTGYNGGPWRAGNERFPDMKGLAAAMKEKGVHPGIWIRLLYDKESKFSEDMRLQRNHDFLDPSHEEVKRLVREDIRRLSEWGYELIKHDFSTYDLLGCWGFQMGSKLTEDGWHFYDRTKTTAEVIRDFYAEVLSAAGKSLILGCNCIGHLGAGMMHINRTGDDTSGREWERTRKMGINTLAFRMPQHKRFFEVDADCVGITDQIDWYFNSQWLTLLANSGTPLFVSVKPDSLDKEQEMELKRAYAIASRQDTIAEPLDWMETTCPSRWNIIGEKQCFHWNEKYI